MNPFKSTILMISKFFFSGKMKLNDPLLVSFKSKIQNNEYENVVNEIKVISEVDDPSKSSFNGALISDLLLG